MREISDEDRAKLDGLHLQVRRERDFERQVQLVNQILEILDYGSKPYAAQPTLPLAI